MFKGLFIKGNSCKSDIKLSKKTLISFLTNSIFIKAGEWLVQ